MNKKIIPAEASFFVPVEKVLFDHSRMRRSLETAAAENYPALTEDILWDYTLFTFEKKAVGTYKRNRQKHLRRRVHKAQQPQLCLLCLCCRFSKRLYRRQGLSA